VKILGIDPGFAFLGLGLVEFEARATRVLHHETYRTRTSSDDHDRLDAIADHICDAIERWQPDAIGYENQATVIAGKAGGDENAVASVGFKARRLLEVCGIIRAAARFNAVPCYVLAPSTIKVAVLGKGGSRKKKDAVKGAVRTIFRLGECSEHAADAIAIAIATRSKHRQAAMIVTSHADLIH
jgi:crossover junction endodeoxyribonuclease RuvC